MKREKQSKYILVSADKKELLLKEKLFLLKLGANGIIRIEDKQYKYLPKGRFLAHFNLERCGHKVGYTYVLPRIVRHGYYSKIKNKELLPLLSFKRVVFGECVKVEERIKYSELKSRHFKNSFTNIKNIKQLQKAILSRYTRSMPDLTKEDILKLGVSYTLLKIG